MPSTHIASPERRWRAASAALLAAGIGWYLSESLRLRMRADTSPGLPQTVKIIVISTAVVVGACLAALIMRTHLTVDDEGLTDYRLLRVVRVPWPLITGFEVGRPRALWGGICVIAACRDNTTVDLMSTRAYSRIPSTRHLDELQRIRWNLEEAAANWMGDKPPS